MIKCYKTAHAIQDTQQYVIKCICNILNMPVHALPASSDKRNINKNNPEAPEYAAV